MNPSNRPVWLAAAAGLLSAGVATILVFSGRAVWAPWYAIPVVCLVLGFVGFVGLLVPSVGAAISSPHRTYKEHQMTTLRRDARYQQRLRCDNGHVYVDVVRCLDPLGLLPDGRTTHLCPECGTEEVHENLGVEAANDAAQRAEELGVLRYEDGQF